MYLWKVIRHVLLYGIILWNVLSCTNIFNSPQEDIQIKFPINGTCYDEGVLVSFIANKPVHWESNKDGFLGAGKSLSTALSVGAHTIKAIGTDGGSALVSVTIQEIPYISGEWRFSVPQYVTKSLPLPVGNYYPLLVGGSGALAIQVEISGIPATLSQKMSQKMNYSTQPDIKVPLRDPQFSLPRSFMSIQAGLSQRVAQGIQPGKISLDYTIGTVRTFHVADPSKGTAEPGWIVNARCITKTDSTVLWLDTEDTVDEALLSSFITTLSEKVLPRMRLIVGTHIDPDEDGIFHILMTGKLNDQKMAIGFFNPCDFFPYNDDISSDAYNPTSNELDILYMGCITDTTDQNYNLYALLATAAHEYQHLVRFSRKTYYRLLQGDSDPPIEDTAFDEGMSHLIESLAGYGVSGGNCAFISAYLQNTDVITLYGADRDGSIDSAGKRGMDALFLYWLMEKAGGFSFSNEAIVDLGGLQFIKDSISYYGTGWTYLQEKFGKDISRLLTEFAMEITEFPFSSIEVYIIKDPYTQEPLTIHPYMGVVQSPQVPGKT
jgi:hypothetical protein